MASFLWLPTAAAERRAEVGLPTGDGTFFFACFNQMYKLSPDIVDVWVRILRRVPNAVLWLLRHPVTAEVLPAGEKRGRKGGGWGLNASVCVVSRIELPQYHISVAQFASGAGPDRA